MFSNKKWTVLCVAVLVGQSSCDFQSGETVHGGIQLGDSSTIVTETDSQYLKNTFDDMVISEKKLTVDTPSAGPATDTSGVAQTAPGPGASGTGYKLSLSKNELMLQGVDGKRIKKNSNVAYATTIDNYPSKAVSHAGDGIIRNRYIAAAYLKINGKKIKLSGLGTYTSPWQVTRSSASTFDLPAINRPDFSNVAANKLQNALKDELKNQKLSAKDQKQWQAETRKINSIKHPSIEIKVEKIEWDIEINGQSDQIYFSL